MNYQGATGTHAVNDILFTLPEGYRPLNSFSVPFVLNNTAYGVVNVSGGTGVGKIDFISSTSADGRIYFNIAYPVS